MSQLEDFSNDTQRLTVLRAQQGQREALNLLIDTYDQRLMYFIRRILGNADGGLDVLQSVWLTVHRKLGALKSPDAFKVWLYRIAHDAAVSELRRRIKRPILVDDQKFHQLADPDGDQNLPDENVELVHRALESLSIDHRRVLTLRYLEDMSIEEIAIVVGCQDGTVKSRLHYAKLALRRRIEELTDA
jgi:RNA polymerase sigma-70 factor (ECF subfamily)